MIVKPPRSPYLSLEWQEDRTEHRDEKAYTSHDAEGHGKRLQSLSGIHASHRRNLPKTAVVHPRKQLGTATDGQRDIYRVKRQRL